MLEEAFGESVMKKKQVFVSANVSKRAVKTLKMTRVGQPGTLTTNENVEQIKKIVLVNRRITIRDVAEEVGISYRSYKAIFTKVLGMK